MFYSSKEVGREIGVATTTIYNWESRGLIVPAKKTLTNRRFYSEEQVIALKQGDFDNPVLKGGTSNE